VKLCRFQAAGTIRVGLLTPEDTVLDLGGEPTVSVAAILNSDDPVAQVDSLAAASDRTLSVDEVTLLSPIDRQEVWAAGVTYLRSKTARMEESDFSATAYDRVYDAPRPEIFFKALAEKVVATGDGVGIRRDGRWNVPEPELALVINAGGRIVGFTIGNDMSSRDIEGENLLYLPQAKVYSRSCALGPVIVLGDSETEARSWEISINIVRNGSTVFSGSTSVAQIKRGFDELAGYLYRSQEFPNGAVLLTGTGVVPPDDFTLAEHDRVDIEISGIGRLSNPVVRV
jgi:2-dehydro-3-deoxy-D-arabinonate dehydratase